MAAKGSPAEVEDKSAIYTPIVLSFRAIYGEVRGDPIEPHQPGGNPAPELQVHTAPQGIGPSGVSGRGNHGYLVIPPISEPNQKMAENVELLEAAVGGLRAKQTEQFLAVEVLSPRRQRSNIHHMVRELGVELA